LSFWGYNVKPNDIAIEAANAANEKKASRMTALDLRGLSDLCDVQMICSGENERQTKAIADAITGHIKQKGGGHPVAVEGLQTGSWILIDYGSVIIHVFMNEYRDYYALESLWPTAKAISLPGA
jgi:ribosome-associated protein